MLSAGPHTLSVTFTPADTTSYTGATAAVSITVNKATPTITWPPPAGITYGTTLSATQLNATASVAGAFVYTPAAGAVLPAGVGQTLSVTFTPTDTANYTVATGGTTITVAKATPTITWPTPQNITYGTPLSATQLNATATFGGPAVPGTFAYTPPAGTVLPAGVGQTLSTTFTPTDPANYNTQTANVTITVGKITPDITWPMPLDIAYGTALGASELNASTSVDGTFVYNPAAGAILPAGVDQIAVGDLHADRRHQLHDRDGFGHHQRRQGDAGHHVDRPRGHHLRHGAWRDAAERDRQRARRRSPTRRH